MKKYFGVVLLLMVVTIGVVSQSKDASAYYKKNSSGDWCYAIQYRGVTDVESAQQSEVKGALYSTEQICYDGKSIYKGGYPSEATNHYSRPKFELVDNTTIKVIYCKKGDLFAHSLVCRSNEPTFSLNSYGGDFKKMTQDIQKEIEDNGALATLNYTGTQETLVSFDDNNATADEGKEQYDKTTAENIETIQEERQDSYCYDNSGHLGWIFCPLIVGIGEAMGSLYEGAVEPFLVIEPELFTQNGTYKAWDIFRNFANIAFVILFLTVIFSQLTGVGIDNYGIKRMLPKLIVAAVLINLSYVICQLAVDISNILGNSLNSLFTSIAAQINAEAASPAGYFTARLNEVTGLVGVAGGVAAAGVVALSGFGLIIPILMALVSAVIAVLFMFIILFVRKAIVILLVAVAPVAFVAYIMPNTKRMLFDKWLNVFKGVLTVYPLAGALVGGGVLASSIILTSATNSTSMLLYIGAMLLQVIPFFFLPVLFRNSLNAVGNVGARLSGLGNRLGAGVSRRIGENEGVQMWRARQAAGFRRDGTAGLRQRFMSHMPRALGRNAMARNIAGYQRRLSEQGSLDATFGRDYLLQTEADNVTKDLQASGVINDQNRLQRGLESALRSGDRAEIIAYTDALSTMGDSGRDAVKSAYNTTASNMSRVAAETFAANIMSKHAADYKNNNRSMFDIANGINNGNITREANGYETTRQYMDDHKNQLQISAKAETMAAMDDSAFAEAFLRGNFDHENGSNHVYENGTVDLSGLNDDERRAVGENAYHALQNTTNMKADRVAHLNAILKASHYRPDPRDVRITS